ncbi:unnamed protein product [Haemonchus placei]|uniref:Uncharacterized protein n=1 Tax=Haemonchus placei TaxID=6290 RepID=A0A3P7SPF1_HAEPC|nr:unnamed protein product [Haemonchus placei]
MCGWCVRVSVLRCRCVRTKINDYCHQECTECGFESRNRLLSGRRLQQLIGTSKCSQDAKSPSRYSRLNEILLRKNSETVFTLSSHNSAPSEIPLRFDS